MRTARLTRFRTDDDGTFGALVLDDGTFMFTVEPELNDNNTSVSCIPTGMYKVERHNSPTFGNVYAVKGVANRSSILIHSGNTEDNTEGCIIPGITSGELHGKKAVLSSKTALTMLDNAFSKETFYLTIVDSY